MTTCRTCGAEIYWAITSKGRRMPLDPPGTHPEPNVASWRDATGLLRAGDPPGATMRITLTTSHFATCPQADEHRRRET